MDKHPATVHRWLHLGLQLQRSDPAFRAHIDCLDAALSEADSIDATTRYAAP